MASRPMPGHAKTVSVTTAPPSSVPNCRPVIVTTGSAAFLSVCFITTAASGKPLARAVRTKSWRSTSSTAERVSRAMEAHLAPHAVDLAGRRVGRQQQRHGIAREPHDDEDDGGDEPHRDERSQELRSQEAEDAAHRVARARGPGGGAPAARRVATRA